MAKFLCFSLSISIIIIIISTFSHTQSNPIEMLSNSGYSSMALSLQLLNQTHKLNFTNSTIFSPTDLAFTRSKHFSVFKIQYHVSPVRFSIADLKALPVGTKIPTLLLRKNLIITSMDSNSGLAINGVQINETAVFDDCSVSAFGIDQFFSSSYAKSPILAPNLSHKKPQGELQIGRVKIDKAANFNDGSVLKKGADRFFSPSSAKSPISNPYGEINDVKIKESGVLSDGSVSESSDLAPTVSPSSYGVMQIYHDEIDKSPNFSDGSIARLGIDQLLRSSSFAKCPIPAPKFSPTSQIRHSVQDDVVIESTEISFNYVEMASDSLMTACHALRSNGYSKMATFLDFQLAGLNGKTLKVTMFAPTDESIDSYVENFTDYSSLFRKHVIPSLQTFEELIKLKEGTMSGTFYPGFMINVCKSGDVIVLNNVPVILPNMYASHQIVVHGVGQLLFPVPSSLSEENMDTSFSELDGYNKEVSPLDYDQY